MDDYNGDNLEEIAQFSMADHIKNNKNNNDNSRTTKNEPATEKTLPSTRIRKNKNPTEEQDLEMVDDSDNHFAPVNQQHYIGDGVKQRMSLAKKAARPKSTELVLALTSPPAPEPQSKPLRKAIKKKKPEGSGSGMSELAKQLRHLQAKNEHQDAEIDRLERKLRIMSEMGKARSGAGAGASASEIRVQLEKACQQEAHNELLNQVQSLQAQLEAALMKNSGDSTAAAANNGNNTTNNNKDKDNEISNLQLRIGELEELEESLRLEMNELYSKLQDKSFESKTLQIANSDKDLEMGKLRNKIEQLEKDLQYERKEKECLAIMKDELSKQLKGTKLELKLEQYKTDNLNNQLESMQLIRKQQQQKEKQQKQKTKLKITHL